MLKLASGWPQARLDELPPHPVGVMLRTPLACPSEASRPVGAATPPFRYSLCPDTMPFRGNPGMVGQISTRGHHGRGDPASMLDAINQRRRQL